MNNVKKMVTLFAIAALMLLGGRVTTGNAATHSTNTASVPAPDDQSTTPDPAGDPDGPGGPDGGPDGTDQQGGPGAA